jgi:hypothetical protein
VALVGRDSGVTGSLTLRADTKDVVISFNSSSIAINMGT